MSKRTYGLTAVAIFGAVLAVLLTSTSAQAGTASQTLKWRWSAKPDGAVCTLKADVAAKPVKIKGKWRVRVRGAWLGCNKGVFSGGADGNLSVTAKGPNGKRYGGTTGICLDTTCGKTVYVPYTGRGTYRAMAYVTNGGYLIKYGHDPQVRPYRHVKP